MCTVTGVRRQDGYELFSNRDETPTRGTAFPPTLQAREGVHYIAPTDPDFGGTWIATNEFGVSLCLLNGPEETHKHGMRSRGLLIRDLIAVPSVESTRAGLHAMELKCFRAFVLLLLEPGANAWIARWNGARLESREVEEQMFFITTSSFDPAGVVGTRTEAYERVRATTNGPDLKALELLHKSHEPTRGPYSICMHRDDAETVSFTRIQVTREDIFYYYVPNAPCVVSAGTFTRMKRGV